jgi:hypothetical protein
MVLLAVIVSAPPAAVAIWSISRTVSQLSDPCVRWNGGGGHEFSASLGPPSAGGDRRPNGSCKSLTVNGESKVRAEAICAMVPGGVLLSAVLGMIGVAVGRRPLILAGAFLMLAETFVVFTIAPLTFIAGLAFLFLAQRGRRAAQVQL